MKHIIYTIFILSIIGCHTQKHEFERIVSLWNQKEIIFPEEISKQIPMQYKILNYIDTNGCSMCRLKLYEWKLLKEELDSLHMSLPIIFIAHLENYKALTAMQKINKFPIPIIRDTSGYMIEQNHFPSNPLLQTFLLDENNRVLIIGNPIHNRQIWELYKKEIRRFYTYKSESSHLIN